MIRKYCLDIYPVDLYISTIDCFEEMKRKFLFYPTIKDLLNKENNGSPISPASADGVTFIVRDKRTGDKGVLILIEAPDKLDGTAIEVAAHESTHATDVIWDIIGGIGQGYDQGNEPYAYLLGWIAGKVGQFMIDYLRNKEDGRKEE